MPKIDKDGVVITNTPFLNKPGSHVIYDIEYYIDKDGNQKARPGHKIDWFAYIQASRETCDLSQIVARYLSGESAVINVSSNPIYGDIAAMPRNINEIHDLGERVKTGYDNLSPEVKAIFNNSFDDFYQAVLNKTVDSKIQAYAAAKVEAAKKAIQSQVPPEDGDK